MNKANLTIEEKAQIAESLGDRIMARLAKPHKVVSRDIVREKALSPEQAAIARQIDRIAKG